jgi:RNA recognition motif-containing protein
MSSHEFPCSSSWRARDETKEKSDKRGRAQDGLEREKSTITRIYMGNLPYTAQRQNIEMLLEAEGFEVYELPICTPLTTYSFLPRASIDISIDPFTYRNPSYCFVDMLTPRDWERAMQVLSTKLHGRPLKVKPCVQKRSCGSKTYSSRLNSTRWKVHSQEGSSQRQDESPVSSFATDLLTSIHKNRRLYVGGLPKPINNHMSNLKLRDLFRDFQVEVVSKIKWPHRESTRGNGWYASIDLSTAEKARRATTQLNNTIKWGGSITVNIAHGGPRSLKDHGKAADEGQKQVEGYEEHT